VNAFVSAYRAEPSLLERLGRMAPRDTAAIRRVVSRIDPLLAERAGFDAPRAPLPNNPGLTLRERDVFDLLRQGLTNREIARTLWIEESTVKVHVRHILAKLDVRSRTEAAMLAADILNQPPTEARAD
jgi:DNA-binding NarL/FixJ family response regulator